MSLIELRTRIADPAERVFDLARSIDAHLASTWQSGERAVEGRTRGLIEEGETVTWEATHLGVKQRLKVKITKMDRPHAFEDEMVSGAFHSMHHEHRFEERNGETVMTDRFEFRAPFGLLGRIAESMFLTTYMESFLKKRNEVLKEIAESDLWRKFLNDQVDERVAINSNQLRSFDLKLGLKTVSTYPTYEQANDMQNLLLSYDIGAKVIHESSGIMELYFGAMPKYHLVVWSSYPN